MVGRPTTATAAAAAAARRVWMRHNIKLKLGEEVVLFDSYTGVQGRPRHVYYESQRSQ